MTTLESIVESLKFQLKPHMTDDVRLYDEFIIRMIHDTRAAIIKAQYVSHDPLAAYYQSVSLSIESSEQDRRIYEVKLPSKLMGDIGFKNIRNVSVGKEFHHGLKYHYTSYEEFMMYHHHVYGGEFLAITINGDNLLLRGWCLKDSNSVKLDAIFEYPDEVSGYDYASSAYPMASADLRQLEIVTFQHLASKLGMPADVINNGYDETRNAQIPDMGRQRQTEEESKREEL